MCTLCYGQDVSRPMAHTWKVCSRKMPLTNMMPICFVLLAMVTVNAEVTLVSVLPKRFTTKARADEASMMVSASTVLQSTARNSSDASLCKLGRRPEARRTVLCSMFGPHSIPVS